jgi:hypothetical protein
MRPAVVSFLIAFVLVSSMAGDVTLSTRLFFFYS